MGKPKILVVEDDRAIAKILLYNLEKEGYAPLLAEDGETAVALFRREKPRLILLDLMVPKVDGLEVCRLVRGVDRGVPILMLTAKSGEVDKIVGLEMGADDYIVKPFHIREVCLRDGLQIEDPISLAAKLELLEAVCATGVREVEATAFVSPAPVGPRVYAMPAAVSVWGNSSAGRLWPLPSRSPFVRSESGLTTSRL